MRFAVPRLTRVFYLAFLALIVCAAPVAARGAPAARAESPALWTINGAKGKVYLFGSIHVLPANVDWRSAAVEQALNESKVVVFEVDLATANDPQYMQPLIAQHGMLPQGQALKDVLPAPIYAELGRVCIDMGIQRGQFAPMRPWLTALTITVQSLMNLGFDPSRGVDFQIYAWARSTGKSLATLETVESQLRIFSDLTREQEAQFMQLTLEQSREAPKVVGEMVRAYRSGDIESVNKIMHMGMEKFPALRDRMLKDRNAKWLPQIEKMLADGRTHIVVVGIGHLVGPDSVIAMLRAKNIQVEGPGVKPAAKGVKS